MHPDHSGPPVQQTLLDRLANELEKGAGSSRCGEQVGLKVLSVTSPLGFLCPLTLPLGHTTLCG
jgi:hypothetical protein